MTHNEPAYLKFIVIMLNFHKKVNCLLVFIVLTKVVFKFINFALLNYA